MINGVESPSGLTLHDSHANLFDVLIAWLFTLQEGENTESINAGAFFGEGRLKGALSALWVNALPIRWCLERDCSAVSLKNWKGDFSFTYLKIDLSHRLWQSKSKNIWLLQVNSIHNKIIFSKGLSLCRTMYLLPLPNIKDFHSILPSFSFVIFVLLCWNDFFPSLSRKTSPK